MNAMHVRPVEAPVPGLTNQGEEKSFIRSALAWQGSVTPRVLTRVAIVGAYGIGAYYLQRYFPRLIVPIHPFEYSGAVLGLLLVLRMNSGMDRWWEARKIWGSIVNQSRNLATVGYKYRKNKDEKGAEFLRWVAAWPHVMRVSLRREAKFEEVEALLGAEETKIRSAEHMPTYVGARIADQLREARDGEIDDFVFVRAEAERSQLIDAIGACERIRNTPIPLVLAITIRRFIFLFLLLLPLALFEQAGVWTPIVVCLAAYPMFSLDEIGAELQNPFSPRNLSHLPLGAICATIERNVLALK